MITTREIALISNLSVILPNSNPILGFLQCSLIDVIQIEMEYLQQEVTRKPCKSQLSRNPQPDDVKENLLYTKEICLSFQMFSSYSRRSSNYLHKISAESLSSFPLPQSLLTVHNIWVPYMYMSLQTALGTA